MGESKRATETAVVIGKIHVSLDRRWVERDTWKLYYRAENTDGRAAAPTEF